MGEFLPAQKFGNRDSAHQKEPVRGPFAAHIEGRAKQDSGIANCYRLRLAGPQESHCNPRHLVGGDGWRGEVNVPDLTQVRPDLLALVAEGPFGQGAYCLEFERRAVLRRQAVEKLGPYRKMSVTGRALPLLMVCETELGEESFQAAGGRLPMLTATLERALSGPLTGGATVWRDNGTTVGLHCRR